MFKKLHSKRDPDVTLFSAIKGEFSKYFIKAEYAFSYFLTKHPKAIYKVMLVVISLSLILSFTVFRNHEDQMDLATTAIPNVSPEKQVLGGLEDILKQGQALKETIGLNKQIRTILDKKNLNATDSVLLEQALDRLQYLSKSIK